MLLYLWSLVILATCSAAQLHAQTPLAWSHGSDDTPSVLSAVSDQGHTDLSHPAFPKHGVRITRVKGFCDTTVACVARCALISSARLTFTASVYTGYVDIEARHLFFWFFESRRDPDEDDVMLWLNGGACPSSSTVSIAHTRHRTCEKGLSGYIWKLMVFLRAALRPLAYSWSSVSVSTFIVYTAC
jgi:hypothetical protein